MKNIHLLPTDKPSSLGYHFDIVKTGKVDYAPDLGFKEFNTKNNFQHRPHFIYITNDEDIKEGWKGYAYKKDVKGEVFKHSYTTNQWYKDAKKIILTNDPTLIEDGVQEVNSSFLSFYAENPVDYVEISKQTKAFDGLNRPIDNAVLFDDYTKDFYTPLFEQAKDNWQFERSSGYVGYRNKVTSEWIYEEDYLKLFSPTKETEQKLYTEEEVYFILCEHTAELFKGSKLTLSDWFKKYKK